MSSEADTQHFLDNDYFENDGVSGVMIDGGHIADKEFYKCEFERCHFKNLEFIDCVFEDCTFAHSDLTMSKPIQTAMRGVKFRDCKLMGMNWAEASPGVDVGFEQCTLSYSTFSGLSLQKTRFIECTAREANFIEADLSQAKFKGTSLLGSRFLCTNLTGADFSEALDYYISPVDNTVKKARFSVQAAVAIAESFGIIVVQ